MTISRQKNNGMVSHQPKGSMCAVCEHKQRRCFHLDFASMPVIEVGRAPQINTEVKIVRCTDFKRESEHGK